MTSKPSPYKNNKPNFKQKTVTIVIIVMTLVFSTSSIGLLSDRSASLTSIFGGPSTVVAASSLAKVTLLEGTVVTAELSNIDGDEPYQLALSLTGTGIADTELASPERIAIFYVPGLAGEMMADGQATVSVDILPITMGDLPVLNSALEGLQTTLTGLVNGLITDINDAIRFIISPSLIEINGLDELNAAIDNLNNLNTALADVLTYTDEVEVEVNDDGSIVVSFTDGLGNHLETAVTDIVQSALDDVNIAVNNLEINILSGLPLVGDLLSQLTNDLLLPLIGSVTSNVNELGTNLTNGVINLTSDLASTQVIGNTTIDLNVKIDKPTAVSGEIPVYGAAVNDSTVDVNLLSTSEDVDTVNFPDRIAPEPPTVDPIYHTDQSISGTAEPNSEITILFPDNTTVNGITNEAGYYNISIPETIDLQGGEVLVITAMDDSGNLSDPTSIEVIQAILSLSVPESILFEPTVIDSAPMTILRQDPNWSIKITDTRREGSVWRLLVHVDQPLTLVSNENNPHTLPNALVYIDENNSSKPLEAGPLEIFAGEKTTFDEEITSVVWDSQSGPLIQLVPTDAYAGEYKTAITWTLVDAP